MKSTEVQTLGLVYTEHLVGSEDTRSYNIEELNLSSTVCAQLARKVIGENTLAPPPYNLPRVVYREGCTGIKVPPQN